MAYTAPGQTAHGKGSVYQRKIDGRWMLALDTGGVTDNGKRKRVTVSSPGCLPACAPKCPHRAAMARKVDAKRAEIAKAEGRVTSGELMRTTVKKWVTDWLEIRLVNVRPATYNVDAAAMRYALAAFGPKRLVDLTPRDIRTLHAKVRADGHGEATVARYHRASRKMLRDASQEGLPVPENVLRAEGVGEGENDREAMETVQAVAVMHHASDLPTGARWFVAFHQGLRQGETLGLTWDAVDFTSNTITVDRQLQAVPYRDKTDRTKGFRVPAGYVATHLTGRLHLVPLKTKKSVRVIPMVPAVRDLLLALKEAQTEPNVGNLIWVREDGWPIAKADDTAEFHALQKAAGVKHPIGRYFTPHEIRNTTAQLLLDAGIDPVIITAILGHSDWTTSVVYMKARAGKLVAAMERVAEALQPKALG